MATDNVDTFGSAGQQRVKNMTLGPAAEEENRKKSVTIAETFDTNSNSVSPSEPEVKYVADSQPPPKGDGKPSYTKLESTVMIEPAASGEEVRRESIFYPIEDSIQETFLSFLFSTSSLVFTLALAYWHYGEGKTAEATQTLVVLFVSAITIQLAYAFNRSIKKANIWNESKLFAALSVLPGTLAPLLSFADFVFAIKETRSRVYTRPWTNTRMVYVVESLILAFPQSVLQSVLLIQDPDSIPKVKGLFVLFTLAVMTSGIAWARIRYDSARRPERFGTGVDKIIRSTIVWGNKGLWVTTYALIVVTAQLLYPGNTSAVIIGLLAILVIYEIPIMVSSLPVFATIIGKISGMFFLIPQFVSLFVLVLWVNYDPTVYSTNVGICALGAFSWFESVAIIGWLLDGCSDREMDVLPLYPHFFGNFYSTCCKGQ